MENIKKGDVVGRISHGKDILFKVKRIITMKNQKTIVVLKGITERIEADSYIDDLFLIPKKEIQNELDKIDRKIERRAIKEESKRAGTTINGKILHLDGDRKYSEKSLRYYHKMGLQAIVKNIPENKQPKMVYNLLQYYAPDILVITGHDRND